MAEVPWLWWLARSAGLVAQLALALTVLFGVLTGARGGRGLVAMPVVRELHARWSVAVLLFTAVHVAAVLLDRHAGVSAWTLILPFASSVRTGPLALGTVAWLGLLTIHATTRWMRHLPPMVWRAVHALAFGVLLLGALHGLTAGTDAAVPGVRAWLIGPLAAVVGAVVVRVLSALPTEGAQAAR